MTQQGQDIGAGDFVGQAFAVAGAWLALGVTAGEVIGQRMALGAAGWEPFDPGDAEPCDP